jgi:lipopolysaccharide transport system ATP-binding protein
MNSDVVIRADRLGKQYLIGHFARRERYLALRDVVAAKFRRIGQAAVNFASGRSMISGDKVEELWALRDVSFEIKRGEVAGIIGPNGAGKSTLLKILSRITAPSAGRATIHGRVASLLEVGTGFHPELTGRENIFLNGAILGMSRQEVKAKFDEIVAFADIERFLDTPVKRYSSGMYVRLAFAVAAHLEPEILIVDEVLAVGDAAFQKKCLGKMQAVAHGGRTVLIVSHNMPIIRSLCSRAIVLSNGIVDYDGDVNDAIQHYLGALFASSARTSLIARTDRRGDGRLRFNDAYVTGASGVKNVVSMGEEARVVLGFSATESIRAFDVSLHINDAWDQTVLRLATRETTEPLSCTVGRGSIACVIPRIALLSGKYTLLIAASVPPAFEYLDFISQAITFEVLPDDVYGTGKIPEHGTFFAQCGWQCVPELNGEEIGAAPFGTHPEIQR